MQGFVRLSDYSQTLAKEGKAQASAIVTVLRNQSRLLDLLPYKEANGKNASELLPVEASLPSVEWRVINKGLQAEHATFRTISFTSGTLETVCKIDEKIIITCGEAYGASQNTAALSALTNKITETIFYGDENEVPQSFTGLAPHYREVDGKQTFGSAASGDAGKSRSSVWFLSIGPRSVYGFYPRGMQTGFVATYNGLQPEMVDGEELHVYEYSFSWTMGLCLADRRAVARVANIEHDAVTSSDFEAAYSALSSAYAATVGRPDETLAAFCSRKTLSYILLCGAALGFKLDYAPFKGVQTPHLFGVPLIVEDAVSDSEPYILSAS